VTVNFYSPNATRNAEKKEGEQLFQVLSVHITGFVSYNEIYMFVVFLHYYSQQR
jgi:hypothetical protein